MKKSAFIDKTWFAYPFIFGSANLAKGLLSFIRRYNFKDKVVLIVGGSRGLGLEIARQLNFEGARIVLSSRSKEELSNARQILKIADENLLLQTCDITDQNQVENLVSIVKSKFGSIDVLINCAGEIEVGPVNTLDVQDFENAMKVHFWGPLYTMLAVIPGMRQKGSGRIVNISSIGGKLSVPHLLPYCASKHALVGLSDGMRVELLRKNIYVTTVCPGMMRPGSHVNAKFKGNDAAEYSWFGILNSLPFASTDAEEAAKEIVESCRLGQPELTISLPAQLASKLQGIFPGAMSEALAFSNWLMPASDNKRVVSGWESKTKTDTAALTLLSDNAIERNNEIAQTN